MILDTAVTAPVFPSITTNSGNQCGNVWNDLQIFDTYVISHISGSLTIELKVVLNEDAGNESFGFRDLYVTLDQCPLLCTDCDCTDCITCQPFTYLYGSPKRCYTTCPDGFYGDNGTQTCLPCKYNCATCVTSSANCITCVTPARIIDPPNCSCAKGTYDNNALACLNCINYCADCINGTSCITCKGNRIGTTCTCPPGTWDSGFDTCPPCSYKCNGCTTSATACIACSDATRVMPTCDCKSHTMDDGHNAVC